MPHLLFILGLSFNNMTLSDLLWSVLRHLFLNKLRWTNWFKWFMLPMVISVFVYFSVCSNPSCIFYTHVIGWKFPVDWINVAQVTRWSFGEKVCPVTIKLSWATNLLTPDLDPLITPVCCCCSKVMNLVWTQFINPSNQLLSNCKRLNVLFP